MEYETVIGLEVHCQLATQTKIFCAAPAAFGAEPNTNIDPLTFGLPGSLPVLNRTVVDYAIMLGLAMNCEIRERNRFARKHYFYPDLPKGYQISQFDEPICERGQVTIRLNEVVRSVGITRIHMEEDAGKNIHAAESSATLVDLNRAGVALLEIVTQPDLRSPAEAAALMRSIQQLVRYLGISDGNMEEGSLRCDANISLRPMGEMEFGTRTEIKNLNSFRFVEKALEYEVARQTKVLKAGEQVVQETRLFDSDAGTTHPMRGKEESADYRYMPDPDLPPLVITESWIQSIRERMPALPAELHKKLTELYGLSEYDAQVLTAEPEYVNYFEAVFEVCSNAKAASNWITSELFGILKREGLAFGASPNAAHVGRLIALIDNETISGKMGKAVFEEMFRTGDAPEAIVNRQGLRQITDRGELEKAVNVALDAHPEQVQAYLGGSRKLLGFFVGQVMKETGGNASPKVLNELLQEQLEKRRAL